jgi:hypothetical protein
LNRYTTGGFSRTQLHNVIIIIIIIIIIIMYSDWLRAGGQGVGFRVPGGASGWSVKLTTYLSTSAQDKDT